MQHHYFARYPTDEWHLANVFSLVYFSVVVCLRGLYHHILLATARTLCQGQCTPHARFPLTEGGRLIFGSPLLGRTGGVVELVLGSVFIIELDTGLAGIYFHRYYTEYDVCHRQNTSWPYGRSLLKACYSLPLPSLRMITRMCWAQKCLPGISCRECV